MPDNDDIASDLKEVKSDVKQVLSALNSIQTTQALHEQRIAQLEKIVYAVCSVIGLGFIASLAALVYKKTE
jgi:hypothetical protein